jgi:queuosine precursor transporter
MNQTKLLYALGIYITALFASNLLGMKTMPFLFETHISFAVFTLPFIFVTTDVIGQIYGKEMSKKFVLIWTIALLFFTVFSFFSQILPWEPKTYARIGEAYESIFSISLRIALASTIAFAVSEYIDVLVFFAVKKVWNFALSSTISNIISQALDTAIFMFIAFWGIFDFYTILMMSIPWWIYKVMAGILYLPLSLFVLKILKHKEKVW